MCLSRGEGKGRVSDGGRGEKEGGSNQEHLDSLKHVDSRLGYGQPLLV